MNETKIAVILPAAGKSQRFGNEKQSKLECDLLGKPVFMRSIELFNTHPKVVQTILAVDPDQFDAFAFKWGDKLSFLGVQLIKGGKVERWETISLAMEHIKDEATHVAVHDAARPVAGAEMIDRVFEAAGHYSAVIPAIPISATIRRLDGAGASPKMAADPLDAILGDAGKTEVKAYEVQETIPRDGLWTVQTPQIFERKLLVEAYGDLVSGKIESGSVTDDACLIETKGEKVVAVDGDPLNVKITYPEDLQFALAVQQMRSGDKNEALGDKRKFPTWAESDD